MWFSDVESSGEGAGVEIGVGLNGDGTGGDETGGELAGGWFEGESEWDGVLAGAGDGDGDELAVTWSEKVRIKRERNNDFEFAIVWKERKKMEEKRLEMILWENSRHEW